MQFKRSNWEDISRYFKQTFVKFKETGDKLFYIRNVRSDVVEGMEKDSCPFELYLWEDQPYEVDYVLPHKSFFQYAKRAVLLERIPAKQYQRGLSSGNTKLRALGRDGTTTNLDLSFDTLGAFVEKQPWMSLTDAVANKVKNYSVVLSPRMAYIPFTNTIYVDMLAVATVNKKAKTVYINHPIFKPEIAELVKGTEFTIV